MGQIRLASRLDAALDDLLAPFRQNESTAYIALEFLISPGVLASIPPGSKFARALADAEGSINRQGLDFWQPPASIARMIEVIRQAISGANDEVAKAILLSLLQETDPACIASVSFE